MRNDGLDGNLGPLMAIAAGRAADALSRLVNREIQVKCSRVSRGEWREALLGDLRGHENLTWISQVAFGSEPMSVSMVIDEARANTLLDMLLGRHGAATLAELEAAAGLAERPSSLKHLDSCEIDALKETINIMTGCCVEVLAQELGLTSVSLPAVVPEAPVAGRVSALPPEKQSKRRASQPQSAGGPLEIKLMLSVARPGGVEAAAQLTITAAPPAPQRARRAGVRRAHS
jgi:chemotaxis protein CheY-P-specific phosphatase CheC